MPRGPLLTICKSFMRPHLDYGNVIYDQHYNNTFHEKLESMQYNDAVPIACAIRDSSGKKFYQELGLEFLRQMWWFRKLCCFLIKYLFDKISTTRTAYRI